ncbi:MAG: hypothetical protein ACYCST_01080 [Acidimicrobiales bacterium]
MSRVQGRTVRIICSTSWGSSVASTLSVQTSIIARLAVPGGAGIMDNRRVWNAATAFQIALMSVMSVADLLLVLRLGRTGLPTMSERPAHDGAAYPDSLGDGFSFVRQHDRWFGPL